MSLSCLLQIQLLEGDLENDSSTSNILNQKEKRKKEETIYQKRSEAAFYKLSLLQEAEKDQADILQQVLSALSKLCDHITVEENNKEVNASGLTSTGESF